ncbi:MAG: tRNA glutamyl-Q(34) synthetase GluQRS [Acidimicrobiales bacterium]|nr:tRNA glutamyl-Q(34) synthetase GluQRS [Acidimicrobiales bacterium]
MSRGRFAPSPTGTLHIGNLRTALAAWLCARSAGSEFLLRFEDLDSATARREHETAQRRDLEQLGLDWDGEPVRQSERLDHYESALADLEAAGLTYRCWCSRREIREAASAPHLPPGHYPGTCRDLSTAQITEHEASGRPPALRLRTEHPDITIVDRRHGSHTETVDDFVLRRGDGTPAYNLVVVVDDAAQGVEEVVRADDLLSSTPRHAHLQQLLGLPEPSWLHIPLVLGPGGDRLAKRDGAVTLEDRLALGDSVGRVVAVLAASLGLEFDDVETSPGNLLAHFSVDHIDRSPWTMPPSSITEPW